jgi:hypothetical protein
MTLSIPISPNAVLSQVAQALPPHSRQGIIIIGSLAAGYYFFSGDGSKGIRTKDIDCMFAPHAKAVASARQVTEQLLQAKWSQRKGTEWSEPGGPDFPADKLPMVRLQPPTGSEWFIELLGAPDTYRTDAPMKQYHSVKTSVGYFSICSFGFLALAEWDPLPTPFGIRIARPEMMALANMLHHERIGEELMSATPWKRSNKDLGRVLALAYLAVERDRKNDSNDFDEWAARMWMALNATFPGQAQQLALRAGNGIRALLQSPADLHQALTICNIGLLASMEVSLAAFTATGRRVIAEVIEPLEEFAALSKT